MNKETLISKITERGQITLPKSLRNTPLFKNAYAVEFTQKEGMVFVHPIKSTSSTQEHTSLLDHTMRDWAKAENDNLFDFN